MRFRRCRARWRPRNFLLLRRRPRASGPRGAKPAGHSAPPRWGVWRSSPPGRFYLSSLGRRVSGTPRGGVCPIREPPPRYRSNPILPNGVPRPSPGWGFFRSGTTPTTRPDGDGGGSAGRGQRRQSVGGHRVRFGRHGAMAGCGGRRTTERPFYFEPSRRRRTGHPAAGANRRAGSMCGVRHYQGATFMSVAPTFRPEDGL